VYYYDGRLVVQAVNTKTYAVRTVVTLPGSDWQEKLTVNVDGSYIAAHPSVGGGYRTVIFTPAGLVHPNWTLAGPVSEDGTLWSPTDPEWVCAVRDGQRGFWNIATLDRKSPPCLPAHSVWHPNGAWYLWSGYLVDIETADPVLPGTGVEPVHPDINPADAARGLGARILLDDRTWFSDNTGRPRLYAPTLAQFIAATRAGNWRVAARLLGAHYSSMATNVAHVHAHWSFDGRSILWTSDTGDVRDGTPPGGAGRGTDLFIMPVRDESGVP
jgi:hypothetical protein